MKRRAVRWTVTAALAMGATVAWMARDWRSSAAAPLSRDELAASFDSDIRNLVVRWDPGDPRPVSERHAALFSFVHETYRTSAWIPQSVFEWNRFTQVVAGDVDAIIRDKVGLVLWPENKAVPAYGMAPSLDPDKPLRWTVNCFVCHTAEIDGVAYFGAGTKTFDDKWLGDALKVLTDDTWLQFASGHSSDRDAAANAHRILTTHHHDKIDSLTRARSTAFAASHVELYMRPHGGAMPRVDEVGRGDVKTPPLWHTAAKTSSGRWYSDGSFHGPFPLMASSMELEKDRPFDDLEGFVVPAIKQEFESVIQHLRPPQYPYAIDEGLAAEGKRLFYSTDIGCYRCHGTYDGKGNVDWPGKHVDVGTDRARLDVVSDGFVDAFNHSPLAMEGSLEKSRGYAATPLTGVWANYPYLHNGSVPTLFHLLGPVDQRPRLFDVMAARRFDRDRVGQVLFTDPANRGVRDDLLLRRYGDDRNWFNTARPGCGNYGHDFWSRIRTDENRRALIEYLKTL